MNTGSLKQVRSVKLLFKRLPKSLKIHTLKGFQISSILYKRFWKLGIYSGVCHSTNPQQYLHSTEDRISWYTVCFKLEETVWRPQWYVHNVSWEMNGRAQPFTHTSTSTSESIFFLNHAILSLLSRSRSEPGSYAKELRVFFPLSSSQPQILSVSLWRLQRQETFSNNVDSLWK